MQTWIKINPGQIGWIKFYILWQFKRCNKKPVNGEDDNYCPYYQKKI